MRKKKAALRAQRSNALGFALFIGALIALLVVAGIAIKIFLTFRASAFDGKHQFSLEVKEPGQTRFFVFTPQDSSIHMLLFQGNISGNPQLSLGVPVDASMVSSQDISSMDQLDKVLMFDREKAHATTTIIDGVNLFVFGHTADTSKFLSDTVASTSEDAVFTKLFTDPAIYKEGMSIAIINGTDIAGLGSEIGRLLTHMGGDVVSVTTAQGSTVASAVQYTGGTSYTASRIAQILRLPLMHLSNSAVSDITVVLGTDFK